MYGDYYQYPQKLLSGIKYLLDKIYKYDDSI